MRRLIRSSGQCLFFGSICLLSNSLVAQVLPVERDTSHSLSLNGAWSLQPAILSAADAYLPHSPSQQSKHWQPINVPNNWFLAGYDYDGAVWHRRYFDLPKNQSQNRATLTFNAVDYAADVWLNGQYLGFHEGYFEPFAFDVSGILKAKDNFLAVRVDSPNEMPDKTWSLHKRLIKGVLNHHDTRPAGAWSLKGQDANSGGIWDDVSLKFSSDVAIDVLSPTIELTDHDSSSNSAVVTAHVQFHAPVLPDNLVAVLELVPSNFKGESQRIISKILPNSIQQDSSGQFHIDITMSAQDIQRWWPTGYGQPALYQLRVRLQSENRLLDEATQNIAFRTIRYDQQQHAFFVNGLRIFLRGTNYIASPWLTSMKREDYLRDISLMQDAHINAIRVHAHVTGRPFYDVADETGMLVWQDFPLQWGYDDSPVFADEAARQAKAMLQQLDHHPSIFAWSGHNEPPWNAPWMKYKYPDYEATQNRLLTQRVGEVLATDKTRYAHDYSATDEHLWMGWYSGNWREHAKKTKVSIVSEFGAQALPAVNVLKQIIPAADLWPKTLDPKDPMWESWDYHNFQVQETFKNAGVSRGESLEDFVANSQQYQARLTQLAAESYRRQRYQPVAAMFQFMFNETWPSINWGIVDYQRHPKAGYVALAQAYQPILPSIEWDSERFKSNETGRFVLWTINDTWQAYPNVTLSYRLLRDGKVVKQAKKIVDIMDADSGVPQWELKFSGLAGGNYTLEATLANNRQKLLAKNQFTFTVDGL